MLGLFIKKKKERWRIMIVCHTMESCAKKSRALIKRREWEITVLQQMHTYLLRLQLGNYSRICMYVYRWRELLLKVDVSDDEMNFDADYRNNKFTFLHRLRDCVRSRCGRVFLPKSEMAKSSTWTWNPESRCEFSVFDVSYIVGRPIFAASAMN